MSRVKNVEARVLDNLERYNIEIAAGLHMRAYNSDPFARRRITHYMKMGYDDPQDVIAHATAVLKAREQRVNFMTDV